MDLSAILDPLNDAQREAVTTPPGQPVLVLAGAGSGKTRVLVHRVAWLVLAEDVLPQHLFAVTFTNKAAWEMRHRIESLLGFPTRHFWIGTFHGLAHRLLRIHWREAGLAEGFQIIDSQDQLRIIGRMLKNLGLRDGEFEPRDIQWFINRQKDEGLRPDNVDEVGGTRHKRLIDLYARYEKVCATASVVDFGELLLRAFELLERHTELKEQYRRRFQHVLVDEFQDTNSIQYRWMRLLAGSEGAPFVVGDDDQSIFRWRGARMEHLQGFGRDFAGTRVVRLEQNYRSTGNILNAANAVIAHNKTRLGKNLWTAGKAGEAITLYTALNEHDEADFVIDRIREFVTGGHRRDEAAILYRSNAQSRVFEEALLATGIPYRVYGGLRFFERAEIKDALAYLRLIANRHDDASFDRVANVPPRGIGGRTMDAVRARAAEAGSSLWSAAAQCVQDGPGPLASRAKGAVSGFLRLVDTLADDTRDLELSEQVERVNHASGLLAHHGRAGDESAEARMENLEELVNSARGLIRDEDSELSPLDEFLSYAVLESGETQSGADEEAVQLMTLHSAKGLEFPLVFVCGLEDGLFPHQRSIDEIGGLEEERRLCYVGLTRAERKLYLTCAEQRRLHGGFRFTSPSRFLREIPRELLDEIGQRMSVSRPVHRGGRRGARFGQHSGGRRGGRSGQLSAGRGGGRHGGRPGEWTGGRRGGPARGLPGDPSIGLSGEPSGEMSGEDAQTIRLGQRVRHGKFGDGVVLAWEGSGSHARVQVNFETAGTKWLVLAYAKLELM